MTTTTSTGARQSDPTPISPLATLADPRLMPVRPEDRVLFDRLLRGFVPPNTFDAHAHWYDLTHLSPGTPADAFPNCTAVGYDATLEHTLQWMGDLSPRAGLYFPFPFRQLDTDAANRFLVDELSQPRSADSRGLMMIRPQDDPQAVEDFVKQHRARIGGFKVYHVFAARTDTMNADQGEFMPEWAWEIADRHGLWITMHMVLDRAIADPRNQRYIREHCLRYPNARYVLAHAARGFSAYHTVEGVASLRGVDNVFFDTSAVCEAAAFEAIFREFGVTRLMYGSDFPVSGMRGRAISIADGFFWLYDHNAQWDNWKLGTHTLVGIESLLALRQAARTMHLTDSDLEKLFATNARQLLGIDPAPTGEASQTLYREAKTLIPGGTQLLSKRPEMFAPDQWPSYYEQAIGCEVIDTEGRRFIDMSFNSVGACLLGYADPDVNAAVLRRVTLGSVSVLNSPDEVELARLLVKIHPWAQQARFTRAGGEAMAVAARIARAATGRETIAVCGYHGWSDWYLAANLASTESLNGHLLPGLSPAGVPASLTGSCVTFRYNLIDELKNIFSQHGSTLAAVVMEPTRSIDPEPGFLEAARELCDKHGTKLVFDEVSIGWRLCLGGAHLLYGINPDIAVFAKALGNGFPIAAILGNEPTMQAAQASFISSSFWTEGVGPAAGVATVRKLMRIDVPAHVHRIGQRTRDGWLNLAQRHGLPITSTGHPCWAAITFNHPDAAALTTLFTVRMLKHGFLAGGAFYPTLAHEQRHVDAYLAACDTVFAELAAALRAGDVRQRIGGPVKHTGFARLT